jgi:hypothetical protein
MGDTQAHGATVITVARRRMLECDCGRRFATVRNIGESHESPEWESHVRRERARTR